MTNIKIMDEILANKIAAGEVVERAASVVKELVENSIDANASTITIELIEAGTKQIKVTDDGSGMTREDATLAFSRHATSKIIDEDDLFNINTLGFRGEALPSIASVSRVLLKTSTGDIGTIVKIEGGHILEISNGDARCGTVITISDLFYNTPARLKHMKSLYTELASVTDYVNKIALSHPNIKFVLINNENTLLNTDGSNNILKTIKDIYGLDITKKMLYIEGSNDDYDVKGYITLPEIHRSNRNGIVTLVNGRVVRNTDLNRMINDAYHSYKPDNRYPITVINIEVDPSIIDVNIHPTKMDIKFGKLEELCSLIEKLIKNAIGNRNLIPEVEVKEEVTIQYEEQKINFDEIEEETIPYTETLFKEDNTTVTLETQSNEKKETLELKMPTIYPVGLVHGTYIIGQNDEGMYIIDQHAAKERINYELYMKRLGNPNNESTQLLFPITIELSNSEFIVLKENISLLRDMNFDIEEFGVNSIIVKAHPTWLLLGYEEESIRRIIESVINKEKNFSIEKFNESLATMLACKMSIKANMNITLGEMTNLLTELQKCNNPFNCPHGRPTIIKYTNYDLEKLFKRSGF